MPVSHKLQGPRSSRGPPGRGSAGQGMFTSERNYCPRSPHGSQRTGVFRCVWCPVGVTWDLYCCGAARSPPRLSHRKSDASSSRRAGDYMGVTHLEGNLSLELDVCDRRVEPMRLQDVKIEEYSKFLVFAAFSRVLP